MPHYLILGRLTEKGIQNLKDTVASGERFKEIGKECGVEIRELMWLTGDYDVCCIAESENDQAIGTLLFRVGSKGYIKTSSFRGFPSEKVQKLVKDID